MMEAASTSETSVNFYRTTRRYNPEDSHLLALLSFSNMNEWRKKINAKTQKVYEMLTASKAIIAMVI
jgi:hypothetical protein